MPIWLSLSRGNIRSVDVCVLVKYKLQDILEKTSGGADPCSERNGLCAWHRTHNRCKCAAVDLPNCHSYFCSIDYSAVWTGDALTMHLRASYLSPHGAALSFVGRLTGFCFYHTRLHFNRECCSLWKVVIWTTFHFWVYLALIWTKQNPQLLEKQCQF